MKIRKKIGTPMGIAGASIGMGIVGDAFGSTGLTDAGAAAGKFIAPSVNITMGGEVINQLRKLRRKR